MTRSNSTSRCPKCNAKFDNERNMKNHYGRSHNGSIAGHKVKCSNCGGVFRKTPSLIERDDNHYCSKKCRLEGQSVTDAELVARIHTLKDKLGRVPRRDDIRGKTGLCLGVITNHFGSWNDALIEAGYSPNEIWKLADGKRKIRYYGPNWKRQRKRARERDGNECVRCGMKNKDCIDKNGRSLPVHHMNWDGGENYKHRNRLENLVTLCHRCHGIVERWPVSIDIEYRDGITIDNDS